MKQTADQLSKGLDKRILSVVMQGGATCLIYMSYIPSWHYGSEMYHIDGLVQDCGNSIVNALELLQSRTQ